MLVLNAKHSHADQWKAHGSVDRFAGGQVHGAEALQFSRAWIEGTRVPHLVEPTMETGSSTRPTSAPVSKRGVSIDAVLEAARQAASSTILSGEPCLSGRPGGGGTRTNVYIAVGRVTLSNAAIMTITSNGELMTIFD